MRIIGGKLRGKKLFSPSGREIRPTADRLRESIFNILASSPYISLFKGNGLVLDLFAGTGAFGLEALSRGANSAIFIDFYPNPLKIINKNILACQMQHHATVIKWNIKRDLNCLSAKKASVDFTFIDPPYNRALINLTLNHLHHSRVLKPDALIVVEHDPQEEIDRTQSFFSLFDQRQYGKTLVSFFNYML